MRPIDEIEADIAKFDAQIEPIATYVPDFNDPSALDETRFVSPLDKLGVRPEVEALLAEIVKGYATLGPSIRDKLRELFAKYSHFAWGAYPKWALNTRNGFRDYLILFSLHDQSGDPRDESALLRQLVKEATDSGVDVSKSLFQVAGLSSELPKYGPPSTRQMLLSAIPPKPWWRRLFGRLSSPFQKFAHVFFRPPA